MRSELRRVKLANHELQLEVVVFGQLAVEGDFHGELLPPAEHQVLDVVVGGQVFFFVGLLAHVDFHHP